MLYDEYKGLLRAEEEGLWKKRFENEEGRKKLSERKKTQG